MKNRKLLVIGSVFLGISIASAQTGVGSGAPCAGRQMSDGSCIDADSSGQVFNDHLGYKVILLPNSTSADGTEWNNPKNGVISKNGENLFTVHCISVDQAEAGQQIQCKDKNNDSFPLFFFVSTLSPNAVLWINSQAKIQLKCNSPNGSVNLGATCKQIVQ